MLAGARCGRGQGVNIAPTPDLSIEELSYTPTSKCLYNNMDSNLIGSLQPKREKKVGNNFIKKNKKLQ